MLNNTKYGSVYKMLYLTIRIRLYAKRALTEKESTEARASSKRKLCPFCRLQFYFSKLMLIQIACGRTGVRWLFAPASSSWAMHNRPKANEKRMCMMAKGKAMRPSGDYI